MSIDRFIWIDAKSWCESNGRSSATIKEMCPNWDINVEHDVCPAFQNRDDEIFVWSASDYDNEYAFGVGTETVNGRYTYGLRWKEAQVYAFCQ